jgi:hypothetical protein|tara:strand:+ start:351 stop:518 length:168 start_codon:yes stop_codon:yes gene_type:complete
MVSEDKDEINEELKENNFLSLGDIVSKSKSSKFESPDLIAAKKAHAKLMKRIRRI